MSGKATTLLGILVAAALGIYFKWRLPRRASSGMPKPKSAQSIAGRPVDTDDDGLADIIKRARPALERARELYGH
jgi:hypothetical protein